MIWTRIDLDKLDLLDLGRVDTLGMVHYGSVGQTNPGGKLDRKRVK